MKALFFSLVAIVASCVPPRLCAEVVLFDEFNEPGSSSSCHWYVRGENLKDENNVEEGNLLLTRKDTEQPVPRGGGVWKSFETVSLKEGEILKLTVTFSGAEVIGSPYFRIVLADSRNPINEHGAVLQEPPPRWAYLLGLPTGGQVTVSVPGEDTDFFEGDSGEPTVAKPRLMSNLMSFSSAPVSKLLFSEPRKILVGGHYVENAVLVWELGNKGGVLVSKGSWTGPDGNTTDMLEVHAEVIQHFDFNKIGIGFMVWDAAWDDGKHLAESVSIDSVKLEKK